MSKLNRFWKYHQRALACLRTNTYSDQELWNHQIGSDGWKTIMRSWQKMLWTCAPIRINLHHSLFDVLRQLLRRCLAWFAQLIILFVNVNQNWDCHLWSSSRRTLLKKQPHLLFSLPRHHSITMDSRMAFHPTKNYTAANYQHVCWYCLRWNPTPRRYVCGDMVVQFLLGPICMDEWKQQRFKRCRNISTSICTWLCWEVKVLVLKSVGASFFVYDCSQLPTTYNELIGLKWHSDNAMHNTK